MPTIDKTINEVRHAYSSGQFVFRADVSEGHETIKGNLFNMLKNHLRKKEHRVYMNGMKVNIPRRNEVKKFHYPDLMLTCDERDREFEYFKKHPKLIVEVLSPGTEAFDRGAKFVDYRLIESLQEYVLISQDSKRVDIFRRDKENRWAFDPLEDGVQVTLQSVDFSCSIEELYEDVEIRPEAPPPV